jgi:hypothetical protein
MTVLEPLRCPGCSTRFILGASRVRHGIRRAKCFRCGSVFAIEEAVARLLAPLPDQPRESPELAPSLTMEDLQGAQDEFPDAPPEAKDPAAQPDVPYAAGGSNFASAKDAIARLMGNAPIPAAPVRMGGRSSMDVEATLEALSSTLGAAPEPAEAPPAPRTADLSSTVKLTSEEIKVAMASMGDQARPAMAPAPPRPPAPPAPPAENPPVQMVEPAAAQGADLLKIQLEQETCNNVTIEQMTAWIEQGRVLEYHMVARQYSEHWIEASKVPALRPVFERMRKVREAQADESPRPAPEPPPVKRGLFSGLFGRN